MQQRIGTFDTRKERTSYNIASYYTYGTLQAVLRISDICNILYEFLVGWQSSKSYEKPDEGTPRAVAYFCPLKATTLPSIACSRTQGRFYAEAYQDKFANFMAPAKERQAEPHPSLGTFPAFTQNSTGLENSGAQPQYSRSAGKSGRFNRTDRC